MQRIDGADVHGSLPTPGATVAPGYFTEGNPGGGVPATAVTADWLNGVQEELAALITMEGASLSKSNLAQVKTILERVKALQGSGSGVVTGQSTTWLRGQFAAGGGTGNSFTIGASAAAHIASEACANDGLSAACVASDDSSVTGTDALIGGSRFGEAGGDQVALLASVGAKTTGNRCAALATGGPAFANPDLLSGENCALIASTDPTGLHEQVIAGTRSAAIACERASTAAGSNQLVAASYLCNVEGGNAAILASRESEVTGGTCAIVASGKSGSTQSSAYGDNSAVIASAGCHVETGAQQLVGGSEHCGILATDAVLLGSKNCELARDYNVGGGYDAGAAITFNGSNQNLSWRFNNPNGNLYIDGNNNAGGADYAECFENLTLGEIGPGLIVAREGRKVRPARPGDRVLGVVSTEPTMIGNAAPLQWAGRWARDEFGRRVTAPVAMVRWPALTEERVRVTAAPVQLIAWPAVPGIREAYNGPIAAVTAPPALAPGEAVADGKLVIGGVAFDVPTTCRIYASRPHDLYNGPAGVELGEFPADATEHRYTVETRQAYRGRADEAPIAIPADAEHYTIDALVETGNAKSGQAYAPRTERPREWTVVALLGQVPVRVAADVQEGDDLEPGADGIGVRWGTDSTAQAAALGRATGRGAQLEVMAIEQPFDPAVGYAVAWCLVR